MEPKIRFKNHTEDWKESSIEDIFDIRNGYTPSKNIYKYWNNGIIPWFRMEDIRENGGILKDSIQHITPEAVKESGLFKAFSIILATTATIGVHAMLIADSLANQRFTNFSIRKSLGNTIDPYFVYYSFFKIDEWSIKNCNSGGLLSVDIKSLLRLFFLLPTLEEQKKIADYFTSLDKQINLQSQRLEKLKQIKAASLQSMFPQEGEIKPRMRFKGFEEDWMRVTIGELGSTYSGISGKSKKDFGSGNARYITFLNILINEEVDKSILEFVDIKDGENQNKVHKGDLFFNTSSETPEEVGMCSVLNEDLDNVYLNSFCFGFRLKTDTISPTCIVYLMRGPVGRRIMSTLGQGATRINLSKNNFCKSEILIPIEFKEQEQIASYLKSLDAQITLQSKRLEKLKQIKAACLDKMFV